jgi:AraC-like DNA-binding protein
MTGDPLVNLYHVLRWTRTVYSVAELGVPFAFNAEGNPYSSTFYAVLSGTCDLVMPGASPTNLTSGNFVFLPRGGEARLVSTRGLHQFGMNGHRVERLRESFFLMRNGGDGDKVKIISCTVQFEHPAAQRLIQLMAPITHFDSAQSEHADCIFRTLNLTSALVSDFLPGNDILLMHLADALLLETIRASILRSPKAQTGWLAAIQDRQIGIAVGLMHDAPERSWSLASLAIAAGMSRSVFAGRFAEVVGETPMRYLTHLRMNLALRMLSGRDLSIGVIAHRLGYSSEASFSRAFRRCIGVAPSSVRRPVEKPPGEQVT